MPGKLTLLRGPGGAGKSERIATLLDSGAVQVAADFTALWAAISGAVRDPVTGKYPVRLDSDVTVPLTSYTKAVVTRDALRRGLRVIATTSTGGVAEIDRWRKLATEAAAVLEIETLDPGIDVIRARLTDPATGFIAPACEDLIARWYDHEE